MFTERVNLTTLMSDVFNVYRFYLAALAVLTADSRSPPSDGRGRHLAQSVMMQRPAPAPALLVWSLDGSQGPAHLRSRSQMDEAEGGRVVSSVSTSPSHLSRVSQLAGDGQTQTNNDRVIIDTGVSGKFHRTFSFPFV